MTNKVINLNEVLEKEHGYKFTNFEDLCTQPFIKLEGFGVSALFWVLINGEEYLLKQQPSDIFILGELLSDEVANILEIPCNQSKTCLFNGSKYLLVKKLVNKDESIIHGSEIVQRVLNNYPYMHKKYKHFFEDPEFLDIYDIPPKLLEFDEGNRRKYILNNLNNVEEIWAILSIYFKDQKLIQELIDHLIKMLLFDILTMQADRHIDNWGVIRNNVSGKCQICPLYDNVDSFGVSADLDKDKIKSFEENVSVYSKIHDEGSLIQLRNNLYRRKLLFTVSESDITNAKARKRKPNDEVLVSFLQKSDDKYCELFEEFLSKIKDLDFSSLLKKIIKENDLNISEESIKFIEDNFSWNLFFLNRKVLERGVKYAH